MLPRLDHAACLNLGVMEHFSQIIDRTARHFGGLQQRQPIGFGASNKNRCQQGNQDLSVAHPILVAHKAVIF